MLKIKIITVGRKSDKHYEAKINEYLKRLSDFASVDWVLIPPANGKMTTEEQIARETTIILSKLKDRQGSVILLDERGLVVDNNELVGTIQKHSKNNKYLNFVIGGAFGVSDDLIKNCDEVISLSKLVFPHEIVRLILVEQIYRSYTIINNQPYHHK